MSREITRRAAIQALAFPFFWRKRREKLAGISFRILRYGPDRRRFVHIHGDEKTAREVLRAHVRAAGGRAFVIENEVRNVAFRGGQLDPNRMFSRQGAARNLEKLNPGWDFYAVREALDALDRDRQEFLDEILPRRGGLLIALHNNSPAYSVTEEVPISDRSSLPAPDRPREFILCTDPRDYEALTTGPHNVVLQATQRGEEDGSLSRLCAARRVRYVNIEAPHGGAAAQQAMLAFVERLPVRL